MRVGRENSTPILKKISLLQKYQNEKNKQQRLFFLNYENGQFVKTTVGVR
jgi:hypothetical protein